jgi:hypothetical protein
VRKPRGRPPWRRSRGRPAGSTLSLSEDPDRFPLAFAHALQLRGWRRHEAARLAVFVFSDKSISLEIQRQPVEVGGRAFEAITNVASVDFRQDVENLEGALLRKQNKFRRERWLIQSADLIASWLAATFAPARGISVIASCYCGAELFKLDAAWPLEISRITSRLAQAAYSKEGPFSGSLKQRGRKFVQRVMQENRSRDGI